MDKLLLPPNDSVAELIKRQINEIDDQKLEHNLKLFEKWVDCQPHFPKNFDKNMLKTYLRGTKHNLEAAKRKFEIYFASKNAFAEMWEFIPFTEEELKIVKNITVAPASHLTDEGCRVTVFGIRDPNPDLFDCKLALRSVWRLANLRICKEELNAGDVYIFDATNATPAHLPKLLTSDFKNALYLVQEGFASRIRQIHVVNAPAYMDKFISVVKMLLKEKLRNRIFVDQGITSLKNTISEKSLPKDYGGIDEPSHEIFLKWMKYIDDNKSWFEEQNKMKLIGEIPKKFATTNYDFGVEGSFRQLSID